MLFKMLIDSFAVGDGVCSSDVRRFLNIGRTGI